MLTRDQCLELDRNDPLRHLRDRYHVPDGMIYLDGNSLGLMPKAARDRVRKAVEQEWAEDLITSWNKHGWFRLPHTIGDKIARLVGAGEGNLVVTDTISVNMFKVLGAALAMRPDRKVILSDTGDFPSDLYVAQGFARFMSNGTQLKTVAPEAVVDAITSDVAVVMLTDVDYRTSRRHDMAAITRKAHDSGALIIWDLAHSAGALPVDLLGIGADFAVGCTYKYLNGSPGSPGFVFVHPTLQKQAMPPLVGWFGHAEPFAFDTQFTPSAGISRMQCGTQAVLSLQALDAALDQWSDVDMQAISSKAHALGTIFIDAVEASSSLTLAGPRTMSTRGSHVSFHCQNGYAVMQAMIAQRIIGDFRAPDIIRFGFAPSYNTHVEAFDAASALCRILRDKSWDRPDYLAKKTVT
jgi:kynureninase